MKALISTVAAILCRLLSVIVTIAIAVLSLSVLTQIVAREAFGFSFLPLDDVIPYTFSISIFAGAALLFKEKGHIAITVLSDFLPYGIRRCIVVFSELVITGFLIFLLIYGIIFWFDGRFQYSPLLRMRMFYIYIIVPLSALSGLVFVLDNHLSPAREPPDADPDSDILCETSQTSS